MEIRVFQFNWLQYGIDGGSAGPLRNGKGSVYEGGVRVPAIFRWPGKISPSQRIGAVGGNLDLLTTLAHLAHATLPTDRIIDGCDLWPLLAGETIQSPHQYFHYMSGSREGSVNYLGIRDDRWKLLVNIDCSGKVISRELYDLGPDISERFNRLDQHPEIAVRLNTATQQFYDEITSNTRPAGHSTRN